MIEPRPKALGTGRLHSIFAVVLGLAALVPILRFLSVAFARVNHPLELEWMESAVVDHIRFVLKGQPLYREPSIEFAPLLYVPFYYYVSALFAKVVGIGFLAPRLVSLLSIMGLGLRLALATLTKQVGLVLAVPPLVYRVVRSRRGGDLWLVRSLSMTVQPITHTRP